MKRLDKDQIRKEFNDQKEYYKKLGEKSGVSQLLQDLGSMIDDLKAQGLDVSLDMHSVSSEQAAGMFGADMYMPRIVATGTLRIGNTERLMAIATEVNGQKTLLVVLSQGDIRHNGTSGVVMTPPLRNINSSVKSVVPSIYCNPAADPEALVNLQKEIIRNAAANEAINDNMKDPFGPALKEDMKVSKPIKVIKRQKPPANNA